MIITTGLIALSLNQEIGNDNFLFNHTECSDAQVMEIIKERPNTLKLLALQKERDLNIQKSILIRKLSQEQDYSEIDDYSFFDLNNYFDFNLNLSLDFKSKPF